MIALIRVITRIAPTNHYYKLIISNKWTDFYFALEKSYVILLLKILPTVKPGLKGFSETFYISFQQGENRCQARKYHHASPKCPEK